MRLSITSKCGRFTPPPTTQRFRLRLHWSTVVGTFEDTRDLRVVKKRRSLGTGLASCQGAARAAASDRRELPALGCDLPRGREMTGEHRTWKRRTCVSWTCTRSSAADGVVILGELLNEDVVPAYVSVKATLLAKNGSAIATEESFDKISHTSVAQAGHAVSHSVSRCVVVRCRQRSHGSCFDPGLGLGRSGDRDRKSEVRILRRMRP